MVTRKNSLESETQYDSKQIGKGFINLFFSKILWQVPDRQSKEKRIRAILVRDCVPAVGGLKFSMTQKKLQKVPIGGSASWGTFNSWTIFIKFLGGKNLTPFSA